MGKPIFNLDQIVHQLTTSFADGNTEMWFDGQNHPMGWDAGDQLTFALNVLSDNGSVPLFSTENLGIEALDAQQSAKARLAFQLWDDVVGFSIVETPGNSNANITLDLSSGTSKDGTYTAPSLSNKWSGLDQINGESIWLASDWPTNQDAGMTIGGYGSITEMHEIGHALGLSHPGNYDASQGPVTYNQAAVYAQDTRQYTIMSYFGGYDLVSNKWVDVTDPNIEAIDPDPNWIYPQTPMVDDIAAIQSLYAADTTTRAGDTTYGFNCTLSASDPEKQIYDFSLNPHPIFTIWDAGGFNTLDCSGYSGQQWISLKPGTYSSVDGMNGNVAIAYGTTIQEAIGGAGADRFITTDGNFTIDGGTGAANTLDYGWDGYGISVDLQQGTVNKGYYWDTSGGGNSLNYKSDGTDTILNRSIQIFWGGSGDDYFKSAADNSYTFYGAGGTDNILDYSWSKDQIIVSVGLTGGSVYKNGGVTIDSFMGIEHFIGGTGANRFNGASQLNYVFDGNGNNNTLSYAGTASAITFDLIAGTAAKGGGAVDQFTDIQTFDGSGHGNTFKSAADGNSYTFVGGTGKDTLDYSSVTNVPLTFYLQYDMVSKGWRGTLGVDNFSNIETFIGGSDANTFEGVADFKDYTFEGGSGTDTLDYSADAFSQTFNLQNHTVSKGETYLVTFGGQKVPIDEGTDSFSGIEIFKSGDSGAVFKSAADGNNYTFEGGSGTDTLDYSWDKNAVIVDIAKHTVQKGMEVIGFVGIPLGTDTFSGIETIIGGSAGNTFKGAADGNDYTLQGGAGTDTLDYSTDGALGLTFDLQDHTVSKGVTYTAVFGQPLQAHDAGTDSFSNIEVFIGGNSGTTFKGAADGNNYTFDGGTGKDTLDYSSVTNASVTFDLPYDEVSKGYRGTLGVDDFSGIENFKGTSGADTLFDGPGSFSFDGGGGTDTVVLHDPYKDYDFSQSYWGKDGEWHTVVIDKSVMSVDGKLDLVNVEQLRDSTGTLYTIPGPPPPSLTPVPNEIYEASGPNGAAATFSVKATDVIDGTDPVVFTEQGNVVTSGATFGDGVHTIKATATDTAGDTASENFTITVVNSDVLYSVQGETDALFGNSAHDTFVVYNSADTVVGLAGSNDVVYSTADFNLPTNVDTLVLYGSHGAGNSDASGDALYAANASISQTLTGNSANDSFVVYSSSDVVVPKAGSHDVVYAAASYTLPTGVDTLILEAGTQGAGNSDAAGDALYAANPNQAATLTGNSANDTFVVYNSADVVVPEAGSHDVVYSAVNYTLPTGVDSLFLEGSATRAVGNSDAAGDTLYAANAGIAQTLTGNSHNDTFMVSNSADTVIGQAGSTDTVYSTANFTLPTNVDTLFLEGNAALGTGNSDAADTLFGNFDVASTLVAGSGADILWANGVAGTKLTGGAGADTFAFSNAMGHDEITNFNTAKDTVQFNASLFANFSAAMQHADQVGANTVFAIDANNSVTLDNVNRSNLAAGNFHFT